MATVSFSLPMLYQQAFGYTPDNFDPSFDPLPTKTLQGKRGNGSPYYAKDALGYEYFMPVTVTYNTDTSSTATAATQKSYALPYPIVSVAARKMIIETPLTERVGTVKELIGVEDFEITIRGLIINRDTETKDFPEDDVATMAEIFYVGAAIQMACPITDLFLIHPDRKGTDNVVVRSFQLLPQTAVQTVRPYELRLVSDNMFNLNQIS